MVAVRPSLVISVLAALAAMLLKTAYDAGEFKTLVPQAMGTCKIVLPQIEPSEDVEIAGSVLLASSDDHKYLSMADRAGSLSASISQCKQQGEILAVDWKSISAKPDAAAPKYTKLQRKSYSHVDFHPHGINVLPVKENDHLVFVVNHRRDGEAISIFKYTEGSDSMVHVEDVVDLVFRGINDVVAVSADEFYVSNWLYYQMSDYRHLIEVYGQMPWGYLIHCARLKGESSRGFQCKVVMDGMYMTNGVLLERKADKTFLFAVESVGKVINKYRVHSNGSLTPVFRQSSLESACDNLSHDLDHPGRMLTACHPKMLSFVYYTGDPSTRSCPSQLVSFDTETGHMTQEYLTLDAFDAATVAVRRDGKTVFGAVFEKGLLVCE